MTIEEVRSKAEAVSARVKADPSYRERIQADPTGVLLEAGIPANAIRDLIRENMGGNDVQGFAYQTDVDPGCNDFTCIVSFCPDSCYVTIPSF